jgi:hypothetical protein
MNDKQKTLVAEVILWITVASIMAICLMSCRQREPRHYPTIYTSEQACQRVFDEGRKRIDSFIILRESNPSGSTEWVRYEDSVKKEIAYIYHELDTTNGKLLKYLRGTIRQ